MRTSLQNEAAASDLTGAALERSIEGKLWEAFARRAGRAGLSLAAEDGEMLRLDVELNAQGIAWVAAKQRGGALNPP